MASVIFNSGLRDSLSGAINFASDAFKVLMVTASYSPNKDTHTKRSDVTNEVTGTGYSAGGEIAAVSVTMDTASDRIDISLGSAMWPSATITAAGAVYYKSRGGLASADEIVAFIDFGGNITSTNGTFSLSASILRFQN